MEMGKFDALIHRARKLNMKGGNEYSIGFDLKDEKGLEYEFIKYKHIYIEGRYDNHPKVGFTITLDDGVVRGEVFHARRASKLNVPRKLEKEILKLCETIDKDLKKIEREIEREKMEKIEPILRHFKYL